MSAEPKPGYKQIEVGYAQWRSFAAVIDEAIAACRNSGCDPKDHFAHISKMVPRLLVKGWPVRKL